MEGREGGREGREGGREGGKGREVCFLFGGFGILPHEINVDEDERREMERRKREESLRYPDEMSVCS